MAEGSGGELTERVGDPAVVQRVFEQLPLMLATLTGPRLRFVAATQAYRTYAAREHITGTEFLDTYPEVEGQRIAELFRRVMETGQAESLHEWRVHFDLPDTGGQMEAFVDIDVWPLHAPDGSIEGVTARPADVTERVRERQAAQQRVAEAERRYARARDVIDEMQRELLPAGVPVLPGVEIAASYLPADSDTAAGGDWFDAVALPDGRVALVVGDVVGHGVGASAVMGKLQVLLSEQLAETGSLGLALEAVDRFAQRVRGARTATLCIVVVDPDTGALDYVTAGHPPPLVVPASGEPRYLAATGDGPLATGGGEFTLGHDLLGPGDLVLLYTDGILERPGRDLAGASVELSQVAADVTAGRALPSADPTTVERVATQSLELLTRSTGHSDDITLLAAQRVAPVEDFAVRTVAVPETAAEVRAALARWLEDAHVSTRDAQAVQHAVGELVGNAVEHAYRDAAAGTAEPGPVDVSASLDRTGQLRVRVRDEGLWHEPSTPPDPTGSVNGRGRGLWMASRLVDELTVEHPGGATDAFVGHWLTRPAGLLTADTFAARPGPAGTPRASLVIERERAGLLRIAGPIDTTTAPEVAAALDHASAAGTRELLVDLAGVTHLASAGVSVLHDADARSLAHGVELALHAPAGSPAGQILTLVALPHTTTDTRLLDAG